MALYLNMTSIWILAFVLLSVVMKLGFKLFRVWLGLETYADGSKVVFDVRLLPEFLAFDVFFEIGALALLAFPTFFKATGLPTAFVVLLVILEKFFWAVALSVISKNIAKIRDYFPNVKIADEEGQSEATPPSGNGSTAPSG